MLGKYIYFCGKFFPGSGILELIGGKRVKTKEKTKARIRIPKQPKELVKLLEELFSAGVNADAVIRPVKTRSGQSLTLIYLNGMADAKLVNEFILKPLMEHAEPERDLAAFSERCVEIAEASTVYDMSEAVAAVTGGMTALFLKGESACLILETRGFEKREVSKPENESIVLGPKESFTESLRTNITLIRRRIDSASLIAENMSIGGGKGASAAILYKRGAADPELIDEVRGRLERIGSDMLISSGVLEQLIEDGGFFPIPRVLSTERPDRAASHIISGGACVLLDGSPFALLMPISFFDLMESPEDIYLRPAPGTLIRVVRYVGAFISTFMPGYFLALVLYHQGMLTTEVLSTVAASREMVFEPIALEMILLLLIFQLIREAGLRVPGPVGQAIGIIGGLIMGQAAVTAHLASPVVLIIVAASGLGNFCIPDYSTQLSASYIRLAMVISAWLGGLLGITAATLITVASLAGMNSFSRPFLTPFAPKRRTRRPLIIRGRIEGGGA